MKSRRPDLYSQVLYLQTVRTIAIYPAAGGSQVAKDSAIATHIAESEQIEKMAAEAQLEGEFVAVVTRGLFSGDPPKIEPHTTLFTAEVIAPVRVTLK